MNVKYYNNNGDEMTFEEVMDYCREEDIPKQNSNIIRLNIQIGSNRNNMVIALAEAGYKVWIEEEELWPCGTNYFVCFENTRVLNTEV